MTRFSRAATSEARPACVWLRVCVRVCLWLRVCVCVRVCCVQLIVY